MEKRVLKLKGIHCADCAEKIQKRMELIEGIHHIKLNFSTGKMEVGYDPEKISIGEIQYNLRDFGYELLEGEIEEGVFSLKNREFVFALVSGIALFIGIYINFFTMNPVIVALYPHTLSELFYIIAMIFGGYHVTKRAIKAMFKKVFVIDTLIIIGASGAVLIDALSEGAAVLFLFSIAELLEDYSVERSRRSLRELVNLTPKFVSVRRGDTFVEIPEDRVKTVDIKLKIEEP